MANAHLRLLRAVLSVFADDTAAAVSGPDAATCAPVAGFAAGVAPPVEQRQPSRGTVQGVIVELCSLSVYFPPGNIVLSPKYCVVLENTRITSTRRCEYRVLYYCKLRRSDQIINQAAWHLSVQYLRTLATCYTCLRLTGSAPLKVPFFEVLELNRVERHLMLYGP